MVRKKKTFNNIAIFSSLNNEKVLKISEQIEEILSSLEVKILIPADSKIKHPRKRKTNSRNFITNNADLIIAIGGDGTLLSASRQFGYKGVPVLGINLGKIGFLTDVAPEDLTESLIEILNGNYFEDERLFLEAFINDSKHSDIALNEVVIHSEPIAQLIEYELLIDNDFVYRQRADGLLISSPTGSTAYSLSGNGPIVHPDVRAITLLPMFPHSLDTRPLIIDDSKEIEIRICKKGRAGISFDGHNTIKLKKGDSIKLKKARSKLKLIHPFDHNFYSACRTKLGWSIGVPLK